jgi:hypothetical protein
MPQERKKTQIPARTPGEAEEAPKKDAGKMDEASERRQPVDPEEEGWSQPESSAQKDPPSGPGTP